MEIFSFAYWSIFSLLAACMASLLFNQLLGVKLLSGSKSKYTSNVYLRSSSERSNKLTASSSSLTPLISNFDTSIIPLNYNKNNDIISDMPDCARDVFLTLRSDDGENNCVGLLVRDDLILTSNECSKFSFTFDFPDEDVVDLVHAVPHSDIATSDDASLFNDDEDESSEYKSIDPRLGFLEANPPYHYHFVDRPVRRARVFLSARQSIVNNGDSLSEQKIVMSCNGQKPIVHNFPLPNGELVPLGHLRTTILSKYDNILWEDRDLNTAPMLQDKSYNHHHHHYWFTRAITRKEEERYIKNAIKAHTGPPGSVNIPAAHANHGYLSMASALCEALDPRGHRLQYCYKNYYVRWQHESPFSNMHFFDWLDYGTGKDLLERNDTNQMIVHAKSDHDCFKKDFNARTVHYFDDEERAAHEVYLLPNEDGTELNARYKQTDELVPSSPADLPPFYMFDMNNKLYIVPERNETETVEKYGSTFLKHTSILAGMPALSAGHAYFGDNGRLMGINYSSGHYKPGIVAVSLMYQWIKDILGYNATALQWVGWETWSTKDCSRQDWGEVKIPGYDSVALNQSCHEVTTSPNWVLYEELHPKQQNRT